MVKVARIRETGGPDVIRWEEENLPPPAAGEVRLRHTAIGLNFIDTYHRSGLYPVPLPSGLGVEAVGVVDAVGPGVAGWATGDRAGTFGPATGAYAEARNVRADDLLRVPADIPDEQAAALLLKGCTAEMLIERCARVGAGMTVLVHAAAGGVGQLLVGWLKALGVTVIGTVGSAAKAEEARAAGADHVILYRETPVPDEVRRLTGGAGVPVVFDGVGRATWEASLASCAPRGLVVSYGNASGAVTGVDLTTLSRHGSLFVTRPLLFHYYATPDERAAGVARLWEMVRAGHVRARIGQRYPLEDVADAHRAMEARATVGASILVP